MWAFVPFTMVVVWHYIVDGFVWRMRDDPSLRDMLAAEVGASVPRSG